MFLAEGGAALEDVARAVGGLLDASKLGKAAEAVRTALQNNMAAAKLRLAEIQARRRRRCHSH